MSFQPAARGAGGLLTGTACPPSCSPAPLEAWCSLLCGVTTFSKREAVHEKSWGPRALTSGRPADILLAVGKCPRSELTVVSWDAGILRFCGHGLFTTHARLLAVLQLFRHPALMENAEPTARARGAWKSLFDLQTVLGQRPFHRSGGGRQRDALRVELVDKLAVAFATRASCLGSPCRTPG